MDGLIDNFLLNPIKIQLKPDKIIEIARLNIIDELQLLQYFENSKINKKKILNLVFPKKIIKKNKELIYIFLIEKHVLPTIADIYRNHDLDFLLKPKIEGEGDVFVEKIIEKIGLLKILFEFINNFKDFNLLKKINFNIAILFNRLKSIDDIMLEKVKFEIMLQSGIISQTGNVSLYNDIIADFNKSMGKNMLKFSSTREFYNYILHKQKEEKKEEKEVE